MQRKKLREYSSTVQPTYIRLNPFRKIILADCEETTTREHYEYVGEKTPDKTSKLGLCPEAVNDKHWNLMSLRKHTHRERVVVHIIRDCLEQVDGGFGPWNRHLDWQTRTSRNTSNIMIKRGTQRILEHQSDVHDF
ncbi:hypothetical protein AVEN_126985-1 [Araneus ventricosus]|uniref:Uncharacterized protein n=1 Tax=Araneus ventricosus TaxID=182803 RepID=A0A4Y2C282_ARAVE|nr:hypothetical protein AVEN_126985-1 [Araneus ventricosus]